MLRKILFGRIDNSQIIVFRIFFGLLMVTECWGSIATGWVKETFVEPHMTFTFIGFECTRVLLGKPMYFIYCFLGLLGLLISLGAFYRISSFLFAVLWSLVYFMQKEHYNNHYYLVMLVSWFMVFIPANQNMSIDARLWPKIYSDFTYNWNRLLFICQLFIVYFFAAMAKLYPDWMNGNYLALKYSGSGIHWGRFAPIILSHAFAVIFSWLGFAFDFLIIPVLLYKKTRKFGFIAAVFFNTFNSITLKIGIFPYFALALCIFCFPPQYIRKLFFKNRKILLVNKHLQRSKKSQTVATILFLVYMLWQIYLPLRHFIIPGDVLWTEEGHRLSWRMMLRTKTSRTKFIIENKKTHETEKINPLNYLTDLQVRILKEDKPDEIWQFAQYLKQEYARKNIEIGVYVNSYLSINGGPYHEYINNKVDLANAKWNYFGHQQWLLPEPSNYSKP